MNINVADDATDVGIIWDDETDAPIIKDDALDAHIVDDDAPDDSIIQDDETDAPIIKEDSLVDDDTLLLIFQDIPTDARDIKVEYILPMLPLLSLISSSVMPYAPIITDDALDAHTLMMIQRMLRSCC